MKVLSLFDGISCGMVALERADIQVDRYVAYEIDEDAIKVSEFNYPQIERKGDVFEASYIEGEFDLLIGGSPCTNWSIAKAGGGEKHAPKREITASGIGWDLFSQYVRALREAKPKYFLYENNVSMSDEIKECISQELGCEPIMINSSDFSAQKRERYYWTNIPVSEWEDKNILFSDIMDTEGTFLSRSIEQYADTIKWSKDNMSVKWDTSGKGYYSQANRAKLPGQKWNTVCASRAESKGNVWLGNNMIRLVTMSELEKLQTLPVGYTSCLKNKEMRGKCIGNGWTVDVIAHIFSFLTDEYKKNKKKETLSCFGDYDASYNQCMRHCDIWIECEKAENEKWNDEVKEIKQMELKINDYQLPAPIGFNYEELKQELTEKVSMYTNLVYKDEQIQEAKKDKANLNKLKKALKDERIRREKEYMEPFNDFKAKINEIVSIIDNPVAVIDRQVKEYEEKQKQEKMEQIQEYFNSLPVIADFEALSLDRIFDSKWLNASVSMKSIQDEIGSRLGKIMDDIATLANLPEFGFEAQQVYKTTLDLNKAIAEGHRMSEIARAKAEREEAMRKIEEEQKAKAQAAEEEQIQGQVEFTDSQSFDAIAEEAKPAKQWISFQALMTTEEALALKDFFNRRNIEFKPLG